MERFEIRVGTGILNDFVFPNFVEVIGEKYKGYGIHEENNHYKVTCLVGVANGFCIADVKTIEEAKWLIDKIIYTIGAAPIDADNKNLIKEYILRADKSKKYMVILENDDFNIINSCFDEEKFIEALTESVEIVKSNLSKIEALKLVEQLEFYKENNLIEYLDKRFYEFSYRNFGYYALIVADSEEEAISIFEDQVCDNEYENYPDEVDSDYAFKILKEFKNSPNKLTSINQCLLVLQGEN